MLQDLQNVLITDTQIRERVRVLGKDISHHYQGVEELTVVSIINGSILFTADLIREIRLPLRLDCIRVSSYRDETHPVTDPEIIDHLRLDIRHRHVLLIDDILDTGRTLVRVVDVLKRMRPSSLRVCVLLEKKGRREVECEADYVGFQIPDDFVVGYGLDFAEHYRNLPCIGVLKPELQNPPVWR